MTEYLNGKPLPISELRLGDCVQLFEDAYGSAIVNRIENGEVWFFRPYGHADSFTYGGTGNGTRVICYVGIEQFSRPTSDDSTVKVWRRERLA